MAKRKETQPKKTQSEEIDVDSIEQPHQPAAATLKNQKKQQPAAVIIVKQEKEESDIEPQQEEEEEDQEQEEQEEIQVKQEDEDNEEDGEEEEEDVDSEYFKSIETKLNKLQRQTEEYNENKSKILQTISLGQKFLAKMIANMDTSLFEKLSRNNIKSKYLEAISNITHPIRDYLFTPPAFNHFYSLLTIKLSNKNKTLSKEEESNEKLQKKQEESYELNRNNENLQKNFVNYLYVNCRGGEDMMDIIINGHKSKNNEKNPLFVQSFFSDSLTCNPSKQTIQYLNNGKDILSSLQSINHLSSATNKYLIQVNLLLAKIDFSGSVKLDLEYLQKVYHELNRYLVLSILPALKHQKKSVEYVDLASSLLKFAIVLGLNKERDYTYIMLLLGQQQDLLLGKLVRLISSFDFSISTFINKDNNNKDNNNNDIMIRILNKFYDLALLKPSTQLVSYLQARLIFSRGIVYVTAKAPQHQLVARLKIALVSITPPTELVQYLTNNPTLVGGGITAATKPNDIIQSIRQLTVEKVIAIINQHQEDSKKRKSIDEEGIKQEGEEDEEEGEGEEEEQEEEETAGFVIDASGKNNNNNKKNTNSQSTAAVAETSTQSSNKLASLLADFSDSEDEQDDD
ncbi:hypothetical protein DFA_06882 [Cavenderia fasciculata]|uniref:Uncharacterized protein n=1 Tax=Cavenderia fasciculata TaxID=261658 RepID=F4PWX8_CACFS|nr:uncharacterized protein DFA_06882 [Cavenderia fasciculata]EGG19781.1 hypothetical protein DFA_06882 [Cavenderia fasciculata]|eukprot:XP_004358127.1 hypothetical protein DFA_06882 [Cavenderia fasciculata]